MKRILMRHGHYVPKDQDPTEPLSSEGREEIERMKRFIHSRKIEIDAVYSSPILRAKQTADLVRGSLPLLETDKLKPMVPPEESLAAISTEFSCVLIVGHLPSLENISAHLGSHLTFAPGGCALFQDTQLEWFVSPQLV